MISFSFIIYFICYLINVRSDFRLAEEVRKSSKDVRIINGSLAHDYRNFSYQVSLTENGFHFCGGVLLNLNSILTAAHCVYNTSKPSKIKVRLGSLNLENVVGIITKTVTTIFIHPGYNDHTLQHDVAVLRIKPLNNRSGEIRNITLAKIPPTVGTKCTIAGWGVTELSDEASPYLRYTEVPIISKQKCAISYRNQIKDGMFCAGYWEGGPDACQGDSGGGIVCNGILSGLISWGYECGKKNFPGVYVDISHYRTWIQKKSATLKITPTSYLMFLSLLLVIVICL